MASRRLVLASSIRRQRWSPLRTLSCANFPLNYYKRNEQQRPFPSSSLPLIHIRSFASAHVEGENNEHDERTYRERARQGAKVARKKARDGAEKSAKVARKGAKTAKEMLQQYGPVFVGTYMSVYFLTWGTLFLGMDSGLLDPVQIMGYIGSGVEEGKSTVHLVVEYMEKYSWTKPYAAIVEKNPHFANLGVAWVTTKFTEPIRLAVTLGVVPKLARHFGFVHVDDEEEQGNEDAVEEEHVDTKVEKPEEKAAKGSGH